MRLSFEALIDRQEHCPPSLFVQPVYFLFVISIIVLLHLFITEILAVQKPVKAHGFDTRCKCYNCPTISVRNTGRPTENIKDYQSVHLLRFLSDILHELQRANISLV